ncbi:methylated-DNA-[protein]-cysteine S-methyltransferase [Natranaerovirga hydrolytica]|uniref:Methylated-DNA--protein-cysteine methyltransferase n=1 Tax=Natranaerovirga hydrolytica TaxID=680378 RepID=A0A4R1MEI3_9FIRM|nr:methylated-DNA--[protein]-cysteine S-methyltransferase [Natranaerovirga hydrolytica]TCK90537.1 methylated-DNA-[protein]-cysteine S-methyltransferase [Natranaerovirga hydrolytica]
MVENTDVYIKYLDTNTPIGTLELKGTDTHLTAINFVKHGTIIEKTNPVLEKTAQQLNEYFLGKRKTFDIPLKLEGTPFMQKVWDALLTVPYGKVCSYKDIAIKVGKDKAYRAVGNANNKNPVAIIVPCHRVIGADGQLGGYGSGVAIKKILLDLEKNQEPISESV